jgi:thioredoxin 1
VSARTSQVSSSAEQCSFLSLLSLVVALCERNNQRPIERTVLPQAKNRIESATAYVPSNKLLQGGKVISMTLDAPIHTNEQSIDRVLRAGRPVILVFWQQGCAPCAQLNPALDRLAAAYASKALIAKVDTRDNPALVRRYNIARLPGLVFVKDGATVAQTSGALPEATLRAWLDHLVTGGPRPALPEGPGVPLDGTPGGRAPSSGAAGQRPADQEAARPEPAHSTPIVVTDATFDQVVGASDRPVLVDFWAPWCGPCRVVAPTVERLAQEFAGRAVVAKLNVDENPRTAQRFAISSIPALFIFQRGQVVERLLGAQPAPALRQALARHVPSS